MFALLQRLEDSNVTLKGDLDFSNQWKYFSDGLLLRKNYL